jgi:alkylated DNA repair dioxygenase AlkB
MLSQVGLFSEPISSVSNIPGLSYIPNFIDKKIEKELIGNIDAQPWLQDLKRRVQHYGYRYDYKARNVTPELKLGDIPNWLLPYCQKLKNDLLFPAIPDQVIVNEYQPGQGISAHIDCIPCFGPTIASLSLGSTCVMDLGHGKTGQKVSTLLEPCSLIVLSGDARYLWQHAIAARKTDRYNGITIQRVRRISLTFRTIRI